MGCVAPGKPNPRDAQPAWLGGPKVVGIGEEDSGVSRCPELHRLPSGYEVR